MAETPQPPSDWTEIRTWRKRTREELLARRMGWSAEERNPKGELAKQRLLETVELGAHRCVGIYWPFRGEIDLRDIARAHADAGGSVALPVVVTKGAAVEFWRWQPGMKLDRGIWNIPIPSVREVVQPDLLIIPLIGYDAGCYRLGYGGGYYDRTLAIAEPRPLCVGLGYSDFQLDTIYPQPHDIPMDMIVTEQFTLRRE